MKILVIGANGFLGRYLSMTLHASGFDVTCGYHKEKKFLPQNCNSMLVRDALTKKESFDIVFLLSSYIPYGNMNQVSQDLFEANITLVSQVVESFQKSRIIFSSSVSVYGNHNKIITEDADFSASNLYGETKLAGEKIIKFASSYQILRFSSLYGKGMTQKTFIPQIIQQAKQSKKITLFGDGSRMQNYLHVRDAVDYCLSSMKNEISGVYLCTAKKSYSNKRVAEIIQKYIPCDISYSGNDNTPSLRYNNKKTIDMLSYTPKISLEKGIEDLI